MLSFCDNDGTTKGALLTKTSMLTDLTSGEIEIPVKEYIPQLDNNNINMKYKFFNYSAILYSLIFL